MYVRKNYRNPMTRYASTNITIFDETCLRHCGSNRIKRSVYLKILIFSHDIIIICTAQFIQSFNFYSHFNPKTEPTNRYIYITLCVIDSVSSIIFSSRTPSCIIHIHRNAPTLFVPCYTGFIFIFIET